MNLAKYNATILMNIKMKFYIFDDKKNLIDFKELAEESIR